MKKTEGYKADIENLDASIKQMSAQIEKLSKSTEGKSFEKVLAETFNSDEFKNGLKEVVEGKRVSYKTEVKSYTGLDSADLTGTVNLTMPNTQVEADAQKLVLLGSVPTYTVPQDKAIIMWPEEHLLIKRPTLLKEQPRVLHPRQPWKKNTRNRQSRSISPL